MCMTHVILFAISYNVVQDESTKIELIKYFLTGCLAMSFLRDRFSQLIKKLFTFFIMTICAWKIKKQRKRSALVFIILNFLFFMPVLFLLILIASILSAPLLPLFTFPIYLIGFPRTKRFWPQKNNFFSLQNFWNFRLKSAPSQIKSTKSSKASTLADSNFYAQLVPELLNSFRELAKSGSIGSSIKPENFYLSRFQDRIIWIQIIESSHSYIILNIKGLELQETSCHTAESQYIDDTFDLAFENPLGAQANSNSKCRANFLLKHNPRPFNCMRPRDILVFDAYSDAKNSLIGILDNPENLNLLVDFYPKILHYFLVNYLIEQNYKEEPEVNTDFIITVTQSSSADLKPTEIIKNDSEIFAKKENVMKIPKEEMSMSPQPPPVSVADSIASKQQIILKKSNGTNDKLEKNHENDLDQERNNDSDNWSDTGSVEIKNFNANKKKSFHLSESEDDDKHNETDPFDFDLDKIMGNSTNKKPKKSQEKLVDNNESGPYIIQPSAPPFPYTGQSLDVNKVSQYKEPDYLAAKNEKRSQTVLAIHTEWLQFLNENVNMPQTTTNEKLKNALMTRAWLESIINLKEVRNLANKEKIISDYETNLWTSHYKFLLKCCQILGVINENSISGNFNIMAIYKLYKGDLPWSPINEKLTKEFPHLQRLLVKAFR